MLTTPRITLTSKGGVVLVLNRASYDKLGLSRVISTLYGVLRR